MCKTCVKNSSVSQLLRHFRIYTESVNANWKKFRWVVLGGAPQWVVTPGSPQNIFALELRMTGCWTDQRFQLRAVARSFTHRASIYSQQHMQHWSGVTWRWRSDLTVSQHHACVMKLYPEEQSGHAEKRNRGHLMSSVEKNWIALERETETSLAEHTRTHFLWLASRLYQHAAFVWKPLIWNMDMSKSTATGPRSAEEHASHT